MDGRSNEEVMVGSAVRVSPAAAESNRKLFAENAAARFIALDDTDVTDAAVIEAWTGLSLSARRLVRANPRGAALLHTVDEADGRDSVCAACGCRDCACIGVPS